MMKFNPKTVGIYSGFIIGFCELIWVMMVALGLAQVWLDFIFGLHFIITPFQVGAFNLEKAILLVVMTSVVGYVFGWAATWLWNRMAKK